jgi:UDP-glucuronate decarboxylase
MNRNKEASHEQKRVLVAGGCGFLGSHLCQKLLDKGHTVVCVDNLLTGSKKTIQHLLAKPAFTFLHHDITIPLSVQVDQIYNLACPASPIYYQKDPVQTIRTNVLGSANLLELARQTSIPILQASTSEVYGNPEVHPQPESYWGSVNPIGLRSCYDEGKRCAESLFFDYHRQYKVPIKVVRIFNTYGPNMRPDDGRVISNFILQALAGHCIHVHGDGSHTRSFCYVDDLIDGLLRMMNTPEDFTGPVNLGNPQELSILELAQNIIALTNSPSTICFSPLPSDDPNRRKPDIQNAARYLGWQPTISLETGLLRTIEYFRSVTPELPAPAV